MNQDAPWDQMVQDQEGEFIDFLNGNGFNIDDIDFGSFDAAGGQSGDGAGAAGSSASGALFGGDMHGLDGGWGASQATAMEASLARAKAEHLRSQQQPPQQYGHTHGHMAVPPTPDSMEIHGHGQFQSMNLQTRLMYESYPRKQQEQMVFTPLVSPAVTPLDTQFQIPEYAVPGEYFSPLTSPAMPAQVHQRSVYSSTSEGASPSDMEIDGSSPQAAAGAQKGKKAKAQKPAGRAVRQSPAMKPQQPKRKPPTSSSIASRDVAELMEGFADGASSSSRPGSSHLRVPSGMTSESGSASPEPLSEVLMPPPATPRSVPANALGRSPMLGPQHQQQQGPVTPATLMRLQQSSGAQRTQQLQPALAPLQPVLRMETQVDELATPTLSARDGADGGSAMATPRTVPASPSMQPRSASSAKGKKRNSSSHPSPALRPRISPSIKPLLPEGTFSADQSALLLATKSNYQNLLEGNTLPGVTYPNALSVNLTSKRTSHKLAEQGRRNRMNTALQELASLLPAPAATPTKPAANGDEAGKEAKRGKESKEDEAKAAAAAAAKEGASKANTVEMAIDFIKALQVELGVMRGKLADVGGKAGSEEASAAAGPDDPGPAADNAKEETAA